MELEKWLDVLSEADEFNQGYAADRLSRSRVPSSSEKMQLIKTIGADLSDEAKKMGFEVVELDKDGSKPNSWAVKFADGTMEKGNFLDIVQKCIEIASNPSLLRKHAKKTAGPKPNRLGEYE